MRYAGTGLGFDILLPKPGAPAEMPTAERLSAWLGALQDRSGKVAVPKFRIESDFRSPRLSAFSTAADFSGIDARRDLHLAQVVHRPSST